MINIRLRKIFENKERIYAAILFILLAVFSIGCLKYHLADFDIFINAAETLSQKGNIYGRIPANSGFNYYYSVFWAILLLPFIKYHTLSKAIWLLLTYFFYCRSFLLIKKYFPQSNLINTKRYNIWIFLILFLTVKMLIENTFGAQLTPFLLWGMLESLSLVTSKNKPLLAGVIMGFLINVKIMPIIFIGYLAYRGYFKAVLAFIATFIILLFIPSLFIGHTYNMFLLENWWSVISPFNTEHNIETIDEGMRINLGALIPAYTMDSSQIIDSIKVKRNFINLNPVLVRQIITLGSLMLAGLSISFLRSFPFKKENNLLKKYWEASYFLLLIPLLMPHQQQYALLLALPLIVYLLYFYIFTFSAGHTQTYYCILLVFIISALIFSPINGLDIIGGKAFSLLKTYKVISFATIALIPVALYCSPFKLRKILEAKNDEIL